MLKTNTVDCCVANIAQMITGTQRNYNQTVLCLISGSRNVPAHFATLAGDELHSVGTQSTQSVHSSIFNLPSVGKGVERNLNVALQRMQQTS